MTSLRAILFTLLAACDVEAPIAGPEDIAPVDLAVPEGPALTCDNRDGAPEGWEPAHDGPEADARYDGPDEGPEPWIHPVPVIEELTVPPGARDAWLAELAELEATLDGPELDRAIAEAKDARILAGAY